MSLEATDQEVILGLGGTLSCCPSILRPQGSWCCDPASETLAGNRNTQGQLWVWKLGIPSWWHGVSTECGASPRCPASWSACRLVSGTSIPSWCFISHAGQRWSLRFTESPGGSILLKLSPFLYVPLYVFTGHGTMEARADAYETRDKILKRTLASVLWEPFSGPCLLPASLCSLTGGLWRVASGSVTSSWPCHTPLLCQLLKAGSAQDTTMKAKTWTRLSALSWPSVPGWGPLSDFLLREVV